MFARFSLRLKMLVSILFTIIVGFVALGITMNIMVSNTVKNDSIDSAWNFAYRKVNIVKSVLEKAIENAEELAFRVSLSSENAYLTGNTQADIAKLISLNSAIHRIFILDGEDNGYAAVRGKSGVDKASDNTSEYKNILKAGSVYISEPFQRKVDGDNVTYLLVAAPVTMKGVYAGTVGIELDLRGLRDQFAIGIPYKSSYVFLLTTKMTLTIHPTASQIGKTSAVAKELAPFAQKKEQYQVRRKATNTGRWAYTLYAPAPIENTIHTFYIGYSVPESAVLAKSHKIMKVMYFIDILVILLMSVVVLLIVRKLMYELGGDPAKVNERLSHIAKGDLTVDIKLAKGDDHSFVFSIGRMVEELRSLISTVGSVSTALKDSSSTLTVGANGLQDSAVAQSELTDDIALHTRELNGMCAEISQNIHSIAEFSKNATTTVIDGRSTVENSVAEIANITDTVREAADMVQRLTKTAGEIYNIIDVIKAIADQTNLLALNAAIEAARAGESGRGFAVVADEVRKLAENTQKSISQVAALVSNIQKEMSEVSRAMKRVTEQVDIGVSSSKGIGDVLSAIASEVAELDGMVNAITSSTAQLASTAATIESDISNVGSRAQEVKDTSYGLVTNAGNLEEMSHSLMNKLSTFKY